MSQVSNMPKSQHYTFGAYLIIAMLLSGCTVTSGKIAIAERLCTLNGGVDLIGYSGNVLCENGALFTSGRSKASGEE